MSIGTTKISMLSTFLSIQEHGHKSYSCLKRQTIADRLKHFYKIDISLSAIDQHLFELKEMGFVQVYKRHGRNSDGTHYNLASNRMLTRRAFWFLFRIGIKISAWLFKKTFKPTPATIETALRPDKMQDIKNNPNLDQDGRAKAFDELVLSLKYKPV